MYNHIYARLRNQALSEAHHLRQLSLPVLKCFHGLQNHDLEDSQPPFIWIYNSKINIKLIFRIRNPGFQIQSWNLSPSVWFISPPARTDSGSQAELRRSISCLTS